MGHGEGSRGLRCRHAGAHHAAHFGPARTALCAAFQCCLQLAQTGVFKATAVCQFGADGIPGDVKAGADLPAAGLYRHRGLAARHQQQTAVGEGGQLVLQKGFDPDLGAGVARQHKAVKCGVVGSALQFDGAALPLFLSA